MYFLEKVIAALLMLSVLAPTAAMGKKSSHSKVIDFEDEVVEGMNKQPLDSLSQLSEAEKRRRKVHLYRKRGGFRHETSVTLRELRYQ